MALENRAAGRTAPRHGPVGVPGPRPLITAPRGARRPWLLVTVTAALVALGAALRLPWLATNPGWDGDEGYNYNIALNLAHGRHQMFALDFAFVQHPPLFFALAAGLFRVAGPGMLALRALSVLFSLGTIALLPALGRAMADTGAVPTPAWGRRNGAMVSLPARDADTGTRIGLLAALAYAVLPFVVLQNRFGYTYNGLAFWTALALWTVLRYRRHGAASRLLVCGLVTAAALATDQEGLYLLPFLFFGLSGASIPRRCAALAVALAGPALYLGAMALTDRAALLFDLTHTAGRVAGGAVAMQAAHWLYNLADLMRIDAAIPVGLAGLALIPHRANRRHVLGLVAVMLLVILKVRDPNPLFRTAEPLLPLVCLGIGAVAATMWAAIDRLTARRPAWRYTSPLLVALLVAAPTLLAVHHDARAAATRFQTPIEGLLPRSTARAESMAAWLNRRLRPDNVVLAMPQVSWLLHARTAELLQAVAITGRASAFYPAGLGSRRWVYDVHLGAARFLVVDDFTRAWIAENPAERALVGTAMRHWGLVYTAGEYRVYENPARDRSCGHRM